MVKFITVSQKVWRLKIELGWQSRYLTNKIAVANLMNQITKKQIYNDVLLLIYYFFEQQIKSSINKIVPNLMNVSDFLHCCFSSVYFGFARLKVSFTYAKKVPHTLVKSRNH